MENFDLRKFLAESRLLDDDEFIIEPGEYPLVTGNFKGRASYRSYTKPVGNITIKSPIKATGVLGNGILIDITDDIIPDGYNSIVDNFRKKQASGKISTETSLEIDRSHLPEYDWARKDTN